MDPEAAQVGSWGGDLGPGGGMLTVRRSDHQRAAGFFPGSPVAAAGGIHRAETYPRQSGVHGVARDAGPAGGGWLSGSRGANRARWGSTAWAGAGGRLLPQCGRSRREKGRGQCALPVPAPPGPPAHHRPGCPGGLLALQPATQKGRQRGRREKAPHARWTPAPGETHAAPCRVGDRWGLWGLFQQGSWVSPGAQHLDIVPLSSGEPGPSC